MRDSINRWSSSGYF